MTQINSFPWHMLGVTPRACPGKLLTQVYIYNRGNGMVKIVTLYGHKYAQVQIICTIYFFFPHSFSTKIKINSLICNEIQQGLNDMHVKLIRNKTFFQRNGK